MGIVKNTRDSYTSRYQQLCELAERQHGLFTAGQARKLGFNQKNHSYHLQKKNWIRQTRGIYRLSTFPLSDDLQWVLWSLWSRNRKGIVQGVYSHQSALVLYDLTDLDPSKLHMTVPKAFRRNSEIPPILVLHYADLAQDDIRDMGAFKVTTPFQTLKDISKDSTMSPEWVEQAANQALDRMIVSSQQLQELGISTPMKERA